MQQAYQAIRVVSEAQTIRVGLSTDPDELMLRELCTVCASLSGGSSNGVKAVVLDFSNRVNISSKDAGKDGGRPQGAAHPPGTARVPTGVEQAYGAIRGVAQPVLGVARDTLSPVACKLLLAADFTLVAEDARLIVTGKAGEGKDVQDTRMSGANAARLRYVTWSAASGDMNKEMERILNMLREKSAVALRFAKASTRLGQSEQLTPLEALRRINTLYLDELMRTRDAAEGMRAFLEKRKPKWRNS
jgi:enoyl-CoA hydratase/carnithine racemase